VVASLVTSTNVPRRADKPVLPSLTAARYVAALWVVAFHLLPIARAPLVVRNVVGSGYLACSFFFVLSGLVLSYTYLDDQGRLNVSPRAFFGARLARIGPAYLLALAALVGVMFVRRMLSWNAQSSPTALVLCATLLQAWHPSYALTWNFPSWSISVELAFYLSFPLLAPAVARARGRGAVVLLIALWLLPLLADLAWRLAEPNAPESFAHRSGMLWHDAIRFHPLFRLPEFLLGVWVGSVFRSRSTREGWERRWGGRLALAGVVLLGACVALFGHRPYPFMHTAYAPLFGLILYGLAHWDVGRAVTRLDTVLSWLGDASYSLYLFQIPVALACSAYPPRTLAPFVLCTVVLHVVALAVSRGLELPLRRALATRRERSPGA
jgi:peptidoglycan/LPS O-acetylase OafA/YrhL